MYKLLATLMLVAPFLMVPAGATQTCDGVLNAVCMGDHGDDEYAACHGDWVDVYGSGFVYVQVCDEHSGPTHVYVCPLAESYTGATCRYQQVATP